MNMPNQGPPRQFVLYDQGRPHWSQGGPLFYDRRIPPPAPHMANFQNPPLQGPPAPQWLRGPVLGGPGQGPAGPQQFDGFGINIPWNLPNNINNNNNNNHNRYNRNHHGRHHGHGHHRHNHAAPHGVRHDAEGRYLCCKCGDFLQNSAESGVHLCDANPAGDNHQQQQQQHGSNNNSNAESQRLSREIQERLNALLDESKLTIETGSSGLQETIKKVMMERVEEIASLHTQVLDERNALSVEREALQQRQVELERKYKELEESQAKLSADTALFADENKRERAEIARQWQQLRDEIRRMEEMNEVQTGRIRLDVGGMPFTTSRLTLTRDSESMLAAMFSGRHSVRKEEDGTVFIDRDGTHFRYILNYLRDGGINPDSLPRNKQVLKELRNEAVYYQLHGLLQQIEKIL